MSDTTPTGIPIEPCRTCGHSHPIARSHCIDCGIASAFIDSMSGMCLLCLNGPVPS